jgi:glycosyltransferase involved in cell wall biosynthesis
MRAETLTPDQVDGREARPLRILLITSLYIPWIGGLELLVHDLAAELVARGHTVAILTSHGTEAAAGLDEVDGIPVLRTDTHKVALSRDALGALRTRSAVRHFVDDFAPDIAHSHDPGPVLWMYQREAANRPLLTTVHVVLSRHFPGSLDVLARQLGLADWVTGVSDAVVRDVATIAPAITGRLSLIRNGVTPAPTVAPPGNPGPPRLLCAGRLTEQKGFDRAIEAVRRLAPAHPDLTLDILGEGALLEQLRAQAAAAGVAGRVTFLGGIERTRVREMMARATIVLVPSRYEGMPLVALEAALAGRPIIACQGPGISDAVVDGRTGLLVDGDRPQELVDAISALLGDPARASRMGAEGLAHVEREWSWEACVDGYEHLYARLTGHQDSADS